MDCENFGEVEVSHDHKEAVAWNCGEKVWAKARLVDGARFRWLSFKLEPDSLQPGDEGVHAFSADVEWPSFTLTREWLLAHGSQKLQRRAVSLTGFSRLPGIFFF